MLLQGGGRSGLGEPGAEAREGEAGGDQVAWDSILAPHQGTDLPLPRPQVGVFSPSLRNHYLNVTPNNLVHIYGPDSGDGNFLKPSPPFPKVRGAGWNGAREIRFLPVYSGVFPSFTLGSRGVKGAVALR